MKRSLVLMVLLSLSAAALAQKADAAFVMGGSFTSDTSAVLPAPLPGVNATPVTIKTGTSIFLEGTAAFRLLDAKPASLYIEVPLAGVLTQSSKIAGAPALASSIGALFITPAVRGKLLPGSPVSPWLSVGGGWAHYYVNFGENKAALQFGGGVDFKTRLPRLAVRAEVRDFLTEDPLFNVFLFSPNSGLHHHNILVGGGIVFH